MNVLLFIKSSNTEIKYNQLQIESAYLPISNTFVYITDLCASHNFTKYKSR